MAPVKPSTEFVVKVLRRIDERAADNMREQVQTRRAARHGRVQQMMSLARHYLFIDNDMDSQ